MNNKKLLIAGELNVDLIFNGIMGFPQIGGEILASDMAFTLGSSSAIMAANISAMGTATSFCGKIGKDGFGKFITSELEKKHVDIRHISFSESHQTGITVVMNYDQDRANVTYCGAMEDFRIEDIPLDAMHQFQHFHLSSFFLQKGLQENILELFQRAKEAGLTTSLDLQVDPEKKWGFDYKRILPFVDIFFPNHAELLGLTGKKDLEEAIEEITSYINLVALKMGQDGAMLISQTFRYRELPFLSKLFKDAIGAGDSFNAGFLHEYLKGSSLKDCLRNANLMGALNTTCSGGTAAFSSMEEIKIKKEQITKKEL